MRTKILVLAAFLFTSVLPIAESAAPKAGAKCSSAGKITKYRGSEFRCAKKNGKLIWVLKNSTIPSAPIATPSPTPLNQSSPSPTSSPSSSPTSKPERFANIDSRRAYAGARCFVPGFTIGYNADFTSWVLLNCSGESTQNLSYRESDSNLIRELGYAFDPRTGLADPIKPNYPISEHKWISVCDADPWVEDYLKMHQLMYLLQGRCGWPLRYLESSLPSEQPRAQFASVGDTPVRSCKLQNGPDTSARRIVSDAPMNLSAAAKIAIIGVQAADSSSSGSPKDDHAGYFTEVMGVFQKISDLPWNPTLNWSDNYLSLNKNFGDYKIGASSNNYSTPERVEFVKDVIAIAKRSSDKSPDVETADMLFIVVPPDTHSSLVGQANDRFEVQVGKKNSIQVSILHNWKNYWDSGAAYRFPTGPAHGLFHLGFSIPDHYGDRYNIPYRSDFGDFGPGGTGHWGNMSGAHMDWLAWDKWVARLISDRQVICNSGSGTYWLRPSTIKGELQKLLVIPTGDYTAIAVESVRASGYNMKLADKFLGALVYTINTNEKILGKGIEVIRPANRIGAISTTSTKAKGEFGLSDAALKQGESLNVSGYRIEVIESGKFGDVIRVIKV